MTLILGIIIGAALTVAAWALVTPLGRPVRVVRRYEDQMLRREIEQVEQWYAEDRQPATATYLNGLRVAAIMLGAVDPEFRQERALRRKRPADAE